jgi:hypothetical protein
MRTPITRTTKNVTTTTTTTTTAHIIRIYARNHSEPTNVTSNIKGTLKCKVRPKGEYS